MFDRVSLLAENLRLGHSVAVIKPGIFYLAHREHSFFYKPEYDGILIV